MNDIEILENLKEILRDCNIDQFMIIGNEYEQAIENLLKRNKELEKSILLESKPTILSMIPISEIKEIVDECIPKKENIITNELEYTPNTNANSYLTQRILDLLNNKTS